MGLRSAFQQASQRPVGIVPSVALYTIAMSVMLAGVYWFELRKVPAERHASSAPSAESMMTAMQLYAYNYVVRNEESVARYESDDFGVPLPEGSVLPPLEAPGWLNGAPLADDLKGKVLVIDVWDSFCPYCSQSTPLLKRLYEKFSDRGVVFLGITAADREQALGYVKYLKLPWPNAYGAGQTIDKLQAQAPTVFVVAPDGRVAWNDDRSRWKHQLHQFQQRIDAAIEEVLRAHALAAGTPIGYHERKVNSLLAAAGSRQHATTKLICCFSPPPCLVRSLF